MSSRSSSRRKGFATKLLSLFGVTYGEISDVGMKWHALKSIDDCLCLPSAKGRKLFTKIYDSFKSSLQKWIIYHPYVIQYPIANYYITVKFDDGIRAVNTELSNKVLL